MIRFFASSLRILPLLIIIFLLSLRAVGIDSATPGFYWDETRLSSHAICLREDAHDLYGQFLPAYPLGGAFGIYGASYLYGLTIWQGLFGSLIASNRLFSVFISWLTALGIFLLTKKIGGFRAALAALAFDAFSPWSFGFSRLAWDHSTSLVIPVYSLLFLFSVKRPSVLPLLGIFQAIGLYSYASCQFLSLLLFLVSLRYLEKNARFSLAAISGFIVAWGIAAIPFAIHFADGDLTSRFRQVSYFGAVLHGEAPAPIIAQSALRNSNIDYRTLPAGDLVAFAKLSLKKMISFLNPELLILNSDVDGLVRGYPHYGLLNLAEFSGLLLGVATLVYRWSSRKISSSDRLDPSHIFIICLLALLGLIPAAISWETDSNTLRALCVAPFVHILAGLGYRTLLKNHFSAASMLLLAGLIHALFFFSFYFRDYRQLAYDKLLQRHKDISLSLAAPALIERINDSRSSMPWAYYLLAYRGVKCAEIRSLVLEQEEENIRQRIDEIAARANH